MKNITKPTCLATRKVAESKLFYIEQIDLRFSNGELRTYERLHGRAKGSVLVVPVLNDETILLIREYSGGIDRYELAFPKGLCESHEDPLEAANRELMEEVGYGANKLELLKLFTLSPGYFAAETHIIVAHDLYPKRLPGDEPEEIEVIPWLLKDMDNLLKREDFTEARSIAALFMVRDWLTKRGQI